MKRLSEYTGKEFESVTEEEVERIIAWECAEEGAPMLPPKPVKPKKPEHEPDMQLYLVGYRYKTATKEDALKLIETLNSIELWDCGYGDYKRARKEPNVPESITTESVFSPEYYDKIQNEIKDYEAKKTEYDKLEKEYKAACEARSSISEDIWTVFRKKEAHLSHIEYLKKCFSEYLELAEGNEVAASRFFRKAYPDAGAYLKLVEGAKSKNVQLVPVTFTHEYLRD